MPPFPRAAVLSYLLLTPLLAQKDRITVPVDTRRAVTVRGHLHPDAQPQADLGRTDPAIQLGLVTLALKKSERQQSTLDQLLDQQQNPASPNYHRWLTPEQYGDRFGLSPNDVSQVVSWLRSQGLSVLGVARGRGWITFGGTVAQIENALHTEIHRYQVNGEIHRAPAREPSIPDALAPVVAGFVGLDDFAPRPPRSQQRAFHPQDNLTNGSNALAPADYAVIYNLAPLYAAGYDGTGQTIAIAGATDIDISDVHKFRSMFNLPQNDPQVVVTGPDPGVVSADVNEAHLDLEWSGAVAPNATIIYVNSMSVATSVQYAVDQNLAPVVSYSFDGCERKQTAAGPLTMRAVAQQANAQGITWLVSSGDAGAAGCDTHGVNPIATDGLSPSFPASLPEVTAVGGTEFDEGTGSYWNNGNNTNFASAKSYIPEKAWNDTATRGVLSASGGGASVLYAKPAWQSAPGVPADNARDVPDVSLAASSNHDGYLVYNSSGLASNGGTSASAPSFAGILAILNQYLVANGVQSQPGLGNINPMLYRLARNSPGVFHDVTAGDNLQPCSSGSPDCKAGLIGFTAAPGYDLVTGLGSVDASALAMAWSTPAPGATVTPGAVPASLTLNDSVQLTATVASSDATLTPTGLVSFTSGTKWFGDAPLAGGGGSATASITVYGGQLPVGSDTILASYNGDTAFNASAGSSPIDVAMPAANSAVVPSISPDPVYQNIPDADGYSWSYTIRLTEIAGVGTTLTGFTVNGVSEQVSTFFNSTKIPPNGAISGGVRSKGVTVPSVRVLGFSGQDDSGFQWSQQISLPFYGLAYRTVISSLANAASLRQVYAPGMILHVAGANLASASLQSNSFPLPTKLANTSATVNGVPAPIVSIALLQMEVQIPYETAPGIAVLSVDNNGEIYSFSFIVAPSAPGIYTDSGNNITPASSGSRGQVATLYITGDGAVSPSLATGATPAPITPMGQLPAPQLPVTVTLGTSPATIRFIGIPSGNVGVTRIDFVVPPSAPLGPVSVVVKVGSAASPPANFIVMQ